MNPAIRYAVAVVMAIIVTLVTFYVMHLLISGNPEDREDMQPPPGIRFGPVEIDETVETRDRRRPPPPPPPKEPPPPPDMEIAEMEQQVQEMPDMDMPDLDLSMSGSGPFLGNMSQGDRTAEGDVVPLVRIQPQYPRDAVVAQIEGYVTVRFTIDKTGSVRNPQVIDSDPPRVFDREAIRAILRWKFKPRVVDGQAVEREATQTIDFTLDQS